MPERPRPGEPHRGAGTVVRLHCWAQLAILPRDYQNSRNMCIEKMTVEKLTAFIDSNYKGLKYTIENGSVKIPAEEFDGRKGKRILRELRDFMCDYDSVGCHYGADFVWINML